MATITIDEDYFYDLLMLMLVQKDMHAMTSNGMLDMAKLEFVENRLSDFAKEQQKIINRAREVGFELWRNNKEARLGPDWWKSEPKYDIPKMISRPPDKPVNFRIPSQLEEGYHAKRD